MNSSFVKWSRFPDYEYPVTWYMAPVFIGSTIIEFRVWISISVYIKIWNVSIQPCHKLQQRFSKNAFYCSGYVKWIFTSGGKHQIWHIRVLRYAESKKIGRQADKSFNFGGYIWHKYFCINHLLLGVCLACQATFMCIANNFAIMSQKPKWIYLCMHLHTYVYSECSREVVGSSPTRRGGYFPRHFVLGFYSWQAHIYIYI